ncbi:MAG: hypothetical protein HZA36_00430 [Parcubacteria group bacterium]|nr:hypothetical protein [Parcubacteria group bacterium]
MESFIEYDASTILFNLIAFPPKDREQRDWYLSILKRRFYEWEQHIMKLGYIKQWRGVKNETIGPDEWTKAIFEVFWNECLRDIPNFGAPFFSTLPYEEIKTHLLKGILKPDL